MDKFRNLLEIQLEEHTHKCVVLFKRLIKFYEIETIETEDRLECICEVHDRYSLSVSFMDFPDMSNYGEILSVEDSEYMTDHLFFSDSQQKQFRRYLEQHIIENDIDEDESDVFEKLTMYVVPMWLGKCWREANRLNGSRYNMYYFIHRYFNQPAINLINNEEVWLEDIANKC